MSVGPLGLASSVAGSPLAQTKGSEIERVQHETAGLERKQEVGRKAESAAGIGAADGEEHQTADRDADGRRLWEAPLPAQSGAHEAGAEAERRAQDPSGQSGEHIDLVG